MNIKKQLKQIVFSIVGLIILAFGLHLFLIPSQLAIGGLTGFAMVVHHWIPTLSVSMIMLIGNAVLLVAGFILIGKEFGGLTIFCSLAMSVILGIIDKLFPLDGPIIDDLWMNMLYGILIAAIGMGIVFFQNASTGGTDILAKIINKYMHIEIGKSLFFADFIVTLMAGFTFGIEIGLYALIGILVNAFFIDYMIAGFNRKISVMIYTTEALMINDYINKTINRGTTLYYAQGGYLKNDKMIVNTIVSPREYIKIKQFAVTVDPKVFLSSHIVSEVHGEGFTS